eukprot:TRINITY_DN44428_c0_g1_i1.p1 TRINITY_DN44428_c0_g1~~TRINITY_DN44428_c0_g1_i1.p1  ORF type:complete len:241 (+),score=57.51 TRINITY_DN44428_c0_g1_i1:82-804(+)
MSVLPGLAGPVDIAAGLAAQRGQLRLVAPTASSGTFRTRGKSGQFACDCGCSFADASALSKHVLAVGGSCGSTDRFTTDLMKMGVIRRAAASPRCQLSNASAATLSPDGGLKHWSAVAKTAGRTFRRARVTAATVTAAQMRVFTDALTAGSMRLRPHASAPKRSRSDADPTRDSYRLPPHLGGDVLVVTCTGGLTVPATGLGAPAALADVPLVPPTLKRFRGGDDRCCAALAGDGPPYFE